MEPDIPEDLIQMAAEPESFNENLPVDASNLFQMYETYRKDVRQGRIGNTAKYWLMCLDLIRLQHQIHTAVQTNDFDMRLDAWNKMLPYYFAFNKTYYAKYGTWYAQTMKEIVHCYPGLKEPLKSTGLSVPTQTAYPIRTSIDQRGK